MACRPTALSVVSSQQIACRQKELPRVSRLPARRPTGNRRAACEMVSNLQQPRHGHLPGVGRSDAVDRAGQLPREVLASEWPVPEGHRRQIAQAAQEVVLRKGSELHRVRQKCLRLSSRNSRKSWRNSCAGVQWNPLPRSDTIAAATGGCP